MIYYVYKSKRGRGGYPDNWRLDSKHESYAVARERAMKLCPRGVCYDTEPGHGLAAAFFGGRGDTWSAMIDIKDIHAPPCTGETTTNGDDND